MKANIENMRQSVCVISDVCLSVKHIKVHIGMKELLFYNLKCKTSWVNAGGQ